MQNTSQDLAAKQDLKPSLDLSEIAAQHPVNQQTAILNLNTFDATQLTLLEVLDMAETVDIAPELLATLLSAKQTSKKMRMLYAMAWCIARRADPSLTFAEVCNWKLTVIGEVNKDLQDKTAKRAAIVVGAAQASGLTPDDAQNLTIAQLSAYNRNHRRARKFRRSA